jgi:membrane-bound metal-dependent hydrolase YbcI (DUF457 family)
MFIFFHLLTGLILGFLLGDIFHDRRWIIPCTIGAVLPDLIDKPLGHLILAGSIGYGRIYCHTLLFFFVMLITGLLVWHYLKSPVILALSIGIFSHGILDLLWLHLEIWFWPFMGPFPAKLPEDYFFTLFNRELSNLSEIILALIFCAGGVLFLVSLKNDALREKIHRIPKSIFWCGALILCMLSGITLAQGLGKLTGLNPGKIPMVLWGWTRPEEFIIGGVVFALAAWCLWRWQTAIPCKK